MAKKPTKAAYEAPKQIDDQKKRKEALDVALKKIEKNHGKGAVMKLGEKIDMQVEVIPTGSILLDHALGVGGYPKGRIIEIHGPESSGKTTVALHAIAEAPVKGNRTKIKVVKNKVAPPFKTAEVELMYGKGISKVAEIVDLATEQEIIRKSGAWYDYNDGQLKVQGKEPFKEKLKEEHELFLEIEQKVRDRLAGKESEEESKEEPMMETGIARMTLQEKDDISLDLDGEE